MTMIEVHQWNIFSCRTRVNEALDMFEEPGFIVVTNLIELRGWAAVRQVSSHDDSSVPAEHDRLHKHVRVVHLQLPLQGLQHLVQGVHGYIVQPYKPLNSTRYTFIALFFSILPAGWNDIQLNTSQEANCSIAPR